MLGKPLTRTVGPVYCSSSLPRHPLLLCAALGAALFFSATALKFFPHPWMFITLCFTSLSVLAFIFTRHVFWRSAWFNIAFLFFLLTGLELHSYLRMAQMPRFEGDAYQTGYMVANDTLGYGPVSDAAIQVRKVNKAHTIYDVRYTIGENGLRVTAKSGNQADANNQCALFFGDSFTFGEGVEDHEAMPYVVSELSGRKTHNFAFHGYGPHQMLSAIDHGMVERIVDCQPHWIIYQALPEHVARSAGYASWDAHGPKYVIQDGHAEYTGHFDDHQSRLSKMHKKVMKQLQKSSLHQNFIGSDRYSVTEEDIELFVGIVDTARKELRSKYPKATFHVILWDVLGGGATLQGVRDRLDRRSIDMYLISDILPNFGESRSTYEISPYDAHPSPLAHRRIAEYLVKNIVGVERRSDDALTVGGIR
jgi:hypothetical protein